MAFIMVMAVVLCTGCTIDGKEVYFASKCGWHTVFKIGELSCPQEEAKVYLANYKNLYGNVYGTDLWNGEYNTEDMESSIKDAAIAHLIHVYALDVYAQDQDISLTEAEEAAAKTAAETYFASLSRQEKSYTGATQKDIENMYLHYALAEKVYKDLMGSVDENVSEDEARVMDAYVLFVTDEELAKEIETQLHNGATFERLASTYNEGESIHTSFGRGTYDEAVESVVFQLEDEQCSDRIAADGGYYFFQCLDKYDEELSEQNKIKIVQQRQEQALTDVIAQQEQKYYSDFNQTLWDKITIAGNDKITTNSFFTVFDGV